MRPATPTSTGAAASSADAASRPMISVLAINAGNTNLGDEAVLSGALHSLRSRVAGARIRVYSVNPADTAKRHGVDTAPLRGRVTTQPPEHPSRDPSDSARGVVRQIPLLAPMLRAGKRYAHRALKVAREPLFVVRLWRRLRGTDLFVVAGSNQLEDSSSGPWGYPWTILLTTVLARLVGARVAFVSMGAGPLDFRLSGWMCVRALRLATFASFRDAGSLESMRRLGYHGPGTVVPDLAFALVLNEPSMRPSAVPQRVAVNVFPYGDPQYDPAVTDGGARFTRYVDAIAAFVIVTSARGLQPVLFGSQRADRRVIDLVQDRVCARAPNLGEVERHLPTTLADLIAVIDGSDAVVATRYHGILFAIYLGRPTIGICYQSKSRRLLEMAGIGEFAVEAEGLNAGALLDTVMMAIASGDGDGRIRARAMELHADCIRGFDAALEKSLPGLIAGSRVP